MSADLLLSHQIPIFRRESRAKCSAYIARVCITNQRKSILKISDLCELSMKSTYSALTTGGEE